MNANGSDKIRCDLMNKILKLKNTFNMEQKTNILARFKQWILSIVSVSIASSDVGKCTTCKFNIDDHCRVSFHYAEKGLSKFCIEGELWQATER